MIKNLPELVATLSPYGTHSYLIMLGLLLACGFGLPMPEDIILITGGILSALRVCDPWITFGFCMVGVLLGDGTIFFLGRHFGPAIKKFPIIGRFLNERRDAKVKHVFHRFGDKVIFMGRFMPGLRMPIFLSAGIYHVPIWKFFVYDGFAALISVPVWIYLGYFFGEHLEDLERIVKRVQFGLYGTVAALVAGAVIYFWLRRRRALSLDGKPESER